MKKAFFTLAILVMAFGNMSFAQCKADLKSNATANVLKHYGVRDETTFVPQLAEWKLCEGIQYRTTYVYDEYDYYLIEELWQRKNGSIWLDLQKTTYEYDFFGNVLEVLVEDASSGSWENYTRTSYSYESDLLSEVVKEGWVPGQGAWENLTKAVYNYNGDVTTVLYWMWNGNGWSSNELYTYTFGNGTIELLIQYMRTGAWQNREKYTYTLDFDEHITEILYEYWENEMWNNDMKMVYDFNGEVFNTTKVLYWENQTWEERYLLEYDYEDGNAVHGTCKSYDSNNNSWEEDNGNIEMAYGYNAAAKTYYGSEVNMTYVDLTGLNENAQASFKVYPLPAENEIQIQAEDFQKAEIYSVTGQKLMESTVVKMNVSSLSQGVYLLKVYDQAGKAETQRIIVK